MHTDTSPKVMVVIGLEGYRRFLAKCDPQSREYRVLRNAVEHIRKNAQNIATLDCEREEAFALLALAQSICPEVVLDIATSINLACPEP